MPGVFAAVGQDGLRSISVDGRTWKHTQPGKEGETYRAVMVAHDRIVAVGNYGGNNIFAASADGKTWAAGTHDAKYSRFLRGAVVSKEGFLGLGGDPGSVGSSRPFTMTSQDGTRWTEPHDIAGKEILRRAVWGQGRFVAVGDRGRRATSEDGKQWADVPQVKALDTLIDIAFGDGRFVGVGLHGLRMSTRDGKTWSAPVRGEEGEHLNSVVWTGKEFVAVGEGVTYRSPDGENWERKANRNAPTIICSGGGVFVGARWRGVVLVSEDALEWKEVTRLEQNVEALAFGSLKQVG